MKVKYGNLLSSFAFNFNLRLYALDYYGYTPLHLAVEEGHVLVVEQLIAAEADVNAQLDAASRDTPLHLAALLPSALSADMASRLVAAGADANAACEDGATPLHRAAMMWGRGLLHSSTFSPQRKHFLWDRGCNERLFRGYLDGVWGVFRGIGGCLGCILCQMRLRLS